MTWGLMSSATELKAKFSLGQNKKYCWGKIVSSRKKRRKERIKYSLQLLLKCCFTAVIPPLCELRLGTEKILLMEVLVSFPSFCIHVLCSFSFFFPFSCQYFVSSRHSKLWFTKTALVVLAFCTLSWLAFYVLTRTLTNYYKHVKLETRCLSLLLTSQQLLLQVSISFLMVVGIFLSVFWQLCSYFSCLE